MGSSPARRTRALHSFEPIGSVTHGPMVIVARLDFPARDAGEFIAHLRANQQKLTAALQKAVTDPDVRSRLEAMGIAAASEEQASPASLRAHLQREIDTLGGLLLKAGVKPN